MIKRLYQYRIIARNLAFATSLVALAITLATFASSDARADGSSVRSPPVKLATPSPFPKKPAVTGVLNINTATAGQFQKLPGIGPSKAKRIVAYRARRGPFRRVRDLRRVKGIGRKTLKRLNTHLSVKGVTTMR